MLNMNNADTESGQAHVGRHRIEYGLTFLAIAALFLALIAYELYTSHQVAKETAATDAKNLALVLESKLNDELTDAQEAVSRMVAEIDPEAMRPAAAKRYRPQITRWLKSHVQSVTTASAQRFFDANGDRLYTNAENEPDFNIADRKYFQQLKADPSIPIIFSEVVSGRLTGRPVMFVAKPVRDGDGAFLGIALTAIETLAIREQFRALELGSEGTVAMRRLDNGALVVRFPGAMIDNKPAPGLDIRAALLKDGKPGAVDVLSPVDGLRRIYGYRAIGKLPFYLVVGISDKDYLAGWRRSSAISLFAALLFVASLAAVFFRLARAESRREAMMATLHASRESLHEAQQIANLGQYSYDLRADRWTSSDILDGILGIGSDYQRDIKHWLDLVAAEDRAEMQTYVTTIVEQRLPFDHEYRIVRHDDNQVRWVHGKGKLQLDAQGNPIGLNGVIQDVTERKQTEVALQESRDRFRKIVEQSPLSMALVSMDGTIEYINRKAIETFGYLPQDIPNMDRWWVQAYPDEAYRAEVSAKWMGLVEEALANDHEIEQREYYVTCKDGSIKTMAIFGVWVADQVLVVFEDVTDRKEAEEQIRNLAYFDPLTKLPNRRLVMDRLGQALIASNRTAEFGALMILDLDNFKALNDTMGHDAGDRLLIDVAQRIVASVRLEDTVSRLGGDEYVVMVEGLGTDETSAASQTETIAEKIRIALNQPYALYRGGQAHHSTPSIGVTLFRGNEISIDVLLKQADMALYQAKGAGRNAVRFFNPAMQAAIESRSAMEAALRTGLQQSEFLLFYQPQVDQDGRLIGAEALLRWLPADQALILPAQFIPLAEDTGLIIPLGLWVMQTACAQLRAWSENPSTRHLQISINVSARQFRQEDFVEQVFDTLKQSGANPALLKLELTESVVLENVEDVIIRMQLIKALGATFSLDDFGTGFSSLSYLKRLPLDEVKIDQSFVCDVTTDPNDAAIVRAIIAMSRSLGIQVIAEGVETEAQLHFLKENGCPNFQGYLFGKPMPIGDWDPVL